MLMSLPDAIEPPAGLSFGDLLDWHLRRGTRPPGAQNQGEAWNNEAFASLAGVSDKQARNWRSNKSLPVNTTKIEGVLFGHDRQHRVAWRMELRDALKRTRGGTALAAQPPPEVPEVCDGEIPPPPADFLGRDADITAILDVLLSSAPARAILIQGAPGIGKTALTKAIGNHADVIARFGETNRWFVELETAGTAAALQDAITRTLGADPQQGFKATLERLRRRPGLLVLDNLETPWDPKPERPAAEETLAALAAIPGVALLASFRGRDRVAGPAWALVHPVKRLESPDDAALFGRIAQNGFDGDPHLPLFLAALEGIPLAIELVARRAHGRTSLTALWTQWTRLGSDLAAHPDFAASRLTSLPHSIELSLQSSRLTLAAHKLFRLLGQLPAGIVAEDRDTLLGADGFEAEEALLQIGLAVERGNRLDLLSPLRDHAKRHHKPQPPDDIAWPTRYLQITRELGETIGTAAGAGVMMRLQPEFANISAAISAVLPARRDEAMAALREFGLLAYLASIPAPVLNDLADACRKASDVLGEANCIRSLGDIALARSDHDAARKAMSRRCRSTARSATCWARPTASRASATSRWRAPITTRRARRYEQALPLYRQVGDVLGEANCIQGLGDIALARSDHDAARAAL